MEHFEKQLKRGQKVHMSPDEKSVIRYSISKFIEAHPMPGTILENPILEPKILRFSPFVYHSPFTYMRLLKGVTIVLIALLVGGSTLTYASENALPGDALYPIKVNVKEAIEEKLATTTEAKAQYQVKRIQKRFEEIKTLENKGDLTPEKEAIVEKVFDSHTEALNQTLTTLESEGNQDAILETTAQLLPVLNDYSVTTTETDTVADTQSESIANDSEFGADNLDEVPEASFMLKSVPADNTDEDDITNNANKDNSDIIDSDEKIDETQNYKLAITFIQKIKKEKEHLEERAEKSTKDILDGDSDNENQSINDTIKSIDSLLNSINIELDRDTAEEVSVDVSDDEETKDPQEETEPTDDNKISDSTKIQINSKTSIVVPTL